MRDLRDPQLLGEAYLRAREFGAPIGDAVFMPARNYRSDESCIDKYGRADEVQPEWMEVQVK